MLVILNIYILDLQNVVSHLKNMSYISKTLSSSLVKKYVMAITGFALASFLLIHMLGNLQTFEGGPHAINAYAHTLQTLPWEVLWGFRIGLGLCFVIHFAMAYLLVLENKKSRPQTYAVKKTLAASAAAKTMIYTGSLILVFAVFHILHYTVLALNPDFKILDWVCNAGMYEGKTLHDVYAMMILGFSNTWVSVAYLVALFAIGFHLVHAVSSMFQSIGLRNETVRYNLNKIAAIYAVVIFGGFALNPLAALAGKYTPCQALPVKEVVKQYEAAKAANKDPIFIDYSFLNKKCEKAQTSAAK